MVTTIRFDSDSTAVRRPFDCLSEAINVTVAQHASHSHAELFIYLDRNAAIRTQVGLYGRSIGRRTVVVRSNV